MPIQKLPSYLYNQIAAGEVVERPASVVKELLENAVDAKATSITLEIKNSGKLLIRVKDNGSGIEAGELPLAIESHATSKIHTQEDLDAISTLGFRGEALASIASVSKLTLSSKTANAQHGSKIYSEGLSNPIEIMPCAMMTGTCVEVSELFFNTPARRRFLKADRTEFLHIKEVFIKTALANFNLDFSFISDGKLIFLLKAAKDKEAKAKRLGKLLSADFTKDYYSISSADPNLKIDGMILKPASKEQSLSDSIYIFLNGRPIADKLVLHALKTAYQECGFKDSALRCVLNLTIDPHEVDVNVHPRKDEVRFHESNLIHSLIYSNVKYALSHYQDELFDFEDDDKADLLCDEQKSFKLEVQSTKPQVLQTTSISEVTSGAQPIESNSKHESSGFYLNSKKNSAGETDFSIFDDDSFVVASKVFKPTVDELEFIDKKNDEFVLKEEQKEYSEKLHNRLEVQSSPILNLQDKYENPTLNIEQPKCSKNIDCGFYANDIKQTNLTTHLQQRVKEHEQVEKSNQVIKTLYGMKVADSTTLKEDFLRPEFLSLVGINVLLVKFHNQFFLVNAVALYRYLLSCDYYYAYLKNEVKSKNLSLPMLVRLTSEDKLFALKELDKDIWCKLGFDLEFRVNGLYLKSIPMYIDEFDLAKKFYRVFELLSTHLDDFKQQNYALICKQICAFEHDVIDSVDKAQALLNKIKDKDLLAKLGEEVLALDLFNLANKKFRL